MAISPRDIENEWKITIYVGVGCLAVIIWDILHSLAADYRVVFKRNFTRKTLVFLLSRLFTLTYLLLISIQMTSESPSSNNYYRIKLVASSVFLLSRASTALLFYFRVCAVYNGNHYVVGFFTFTWLLAVAGAVLSLGPIWLSTTIIPPWPYFLAAALSEVLNDTLIFLAIIHKLSAGDLGPGNRRARGWRRMLVQPRASMQRLTDIFLQDSQICYLIAICMNFATITTYFAVNSVDADSPTRIMLVYPNTVVVHIMAAKVYRNLKLGRPGLLPAEKTSFVIGNLGNLAFDRTGSSFSESGRRSSVPDLHMALSRDRDVDAKKFREVLET